MKALANIRNLCLMAASLLLTANLIAQSRFDNDIISYYEQWSNESYIKTISNISASLPEDIEISNELSQEDLRNIINKVENEIKALESKTEFEIIDSPINVKHSREMYLLESDNILLL